MYGYEGVRKMLMIVNVIPKKRRKVVFIHHQLLLSGDSNQICAILSRKSEAFVPHFSIFLFLRNLGARFCDVAKSKDKIIKYGNPII